MLKYIHKLKSICNAETDLLLRGFYAVMQFLVTLGSQSLLKSLKFTESRL